MLSHRELEERAYDDKCGFGSWAEMYYFLGNL